MADELTKAQTLAQDSIFRGRVTAALVYQSRQVITGNGDQSEFSRRYAQAVAKTPLAFTESAAWVIAADTSVVGAVTGLPASQALVPDAAILTAVSAAWTHLAGL